MKKEFTEIVDGTEIRYVLDEATGTYLPDWELPRLHYAKVVKPEFALVWDFKITYEMAEILKKPLKRRISA